jgi:hypothetical protein
MTLRDRLMFMGIAVLAVLGAVWLTRVAPEREHAAKVSAEVQTARAQLASAESQGREARSAQLRYSTSYTSLVTLGQAVPASAETPALIYTLNEASSSHDVKFSSITNGSSGSSSSASSSSSSSSSSPSSGAQSAAQSAGLSQQPFTFVFNGNYIALSKLLGRLEGFTVLTSSGPLQVSGRLLTINGISLTPNTAQSTSETGGSSKKSKSPELTGTVNATAYVLPAGESALGGATASGPAGGPQTSASSNASSGSNGAPTAAVVKVSP